MNKSLIVIAGANGNLGARIAWNLSEHWVPVRALIRSGSPMSNVENLKSDGVELCEVDFNSPDSLMKAVEGASCIVSALSGLHPVIIGAQTKLLEAAVAVNVPRFFPSDFSIDYTKLIPGTNRNLDVRREFNMRLDQAPIAATSILNGAFADMLTGQAPIVLFKFKRVLYWGNPDQKIDFTTIDDTAEFTAAAAMAEQTPRYLRIAGDQVSVRDLARQMTEITGTEFKLFSAGGLSVLAAMIKVTRTLMPISDELYPPWQGMQYLHNMYSGRAKFQSLDNDRFFKKRWTITQDVLSKHIRGR